MINAVKEQKGRVLVVKLTGSIEENVNFEQLIGPPPEELEIICREISRINSVGVKGWIKYFQTCQTKKTKLTFSECSTPIVEQINLISNFTCGGHVKSVFVPFMCSNCKSELIGLFETDKLKDFISKPIALKCTKCGGKAEFDDIPEEYFSFMMRGKEG